MISSLPGKASGTFVDIARLAERFDMCFEAEPGKLDIERSTRTWYSIYQFTSWFTLQTGDYDVIIECRVDDVIQKVQRHHDLIKAHAVR